jgi:hypothetical protein
MNDRLRLRLLLLPLRERRCAPTEHRHRFTHARAADKLLLWLVEAATLVMVVLGALSQE